MDDPINVLWAALGLAIAIEGIIYALFPEAMKKMMAKGMVRPAGAVRAATEPSPRST